MSKSRAPEPGDLVEVVWADVVTDPTGDPAKAAPAYRKTIAYFVRQGPVTLRDWELPCTIVTDTIDEDVRAQSGWTCYPTDLVLSLRVIKRASKPHAKT